MLPKKKRLNKELFNNVMKNGRTYSSSIFSFRYIKDGNTLPEAQYAFVAPKTVAKKAIERNKLRRQGYNALRAHTCLSIPPIRAGIFFYKKGTKNSNYKDIKADVDLIIRKIN